MIGIMIIQLQERDNCLRELFIFVHWERIFSNITYIFLWETCFLIYTTLKNFTLSSCLQKHWRGETRCSRTAWGFTNKRNHNWWCIPNQIGFEASNESPYRWTFTTLHQATKYLRYRVFIRACSWGQQCHGKGTLNPMQVIHYFW